MCGIAGYITTSHSPAVHIVERMVESIRHRGPDGLAFYNNGPLAMGMCRLSINGLEGGEQPLYNSGSTVAVLYNGEIYNYPELRAELERDGVIFRTNSDGEVISHLYDRIGEELFARLDGMFAIALWDSRLNKLILARDIAGEKPLYYSLGEGGWLAFASELSAFNKLPGLNKDLDWQSLWDMPTFLWVPEPNTVYKKIKALPRCSYLVAEAGTVSVQTYRSVHQAVNEGIDWNCSSSVISEIRKVIEDAVSSRLLSDVPIGSFLSGGLDSSIVATLAARELGAIDTFSIGFEALSDPYHGSADESVQAEETARGIGSRHHTLRVTAKDFLEQLDVLGCHAGQPYAVSSGLGILSIAKAANELGIKVLLSGDGADECFGGYSWYQFLSSNEKVFAPSGEVNGIASMQNFGLPLESRVASLQGKSLRDRLWGWHYYAHESEKRMLFSRDFANSVSSSLNIFDVNSHSNWSPVDFVSHDREFYLPNEMLTKVDRMTMAYSVEGRVPFVAPKVLAIAKKLQFDQMVSRNGVLKWMLKDAFADLLPSTILNRPKHGFNVPIDHWLKNEWANLMDETFSSDSQLSQRGLLGVDAHKNAKLMLHDQRRLSGHTIFSLIMMNRWLENAAY